MCVRNGVFEEFVCGDRVCVRVCVIEWECTYVWVTEHAKTRKESDLSFSVTTDRKRGRWKRCPRKIPINFCSKTQSFSLSLSLSFKFSFSLSYSVTSVSCGGERRAKRVIALLKVSEAIPKDRRKVEHKTHNKMKRAFL